MSRTVSYPCNAITVVYKDATDLEDNWEWDEYIDDVKDNLKCSYPSLTNCNEWIGRENHAVLENDHCFITISEYHGLVAVALVPKEHEEYYSDGTGRNNLARNWCIRITEKFELLLGELKKVATFSNGEAVYERIK